MLLLNGKSVFLEVISLALQDFLENVGLLIGCGESGFYDVVYLVPDLVLYALVRVHLLLQLQISGDLVDHMLAVPPVVLFRLSAIEVLPVIQGFENS